MADISTFIVSATCINPGYKKGQHKVPAFLQGFVKQQKKAAESSGFEDNLSRERAVRSVEGN
ncbi:hypothetical protein [Pseudomonas sp. 6D_7.1_Bac1]|uniref:hypothetical protein n=1 Tax=Pseudomonas sp. 6D_7.1_Bac1 TaxID=2971615 RepID=UPI0021C865E6|nr:hypothetical protein [Pseudomonas sp. 6D_7.1_Bac1]MCU1751794.1 hypothetical protein [Pseudomonas sp. 6D_7.1_Bac1]